MKQQLQHITNNNSQFTNSKGDLYAIPSYKSTVAQINEDHFTNGLHLSGCSLSMSDQLQIKKYQSNTFLSEQEELVTRNSLLITFSKRRNTMEHPDMSPGGRNAKKATNTNTTNNTISKRSNIMKHTSFAKTLSRSVIALLTIALIATMAFGQSIIVTGTGSFSGTGITNVTGNINTNGASAGVSITGTVNLNGTTTQQLGVSGSHALTFATLNAVGSSLKQTDVNVAVTDALTVNNSGTGFDIQANSLTLGGSSTLTSGSIDVSDGSSSVTFNQTGSTQTVLPLTYAGSLTLSGTSAKSLTTASVAGAFSQTSGTLTISGGTGLTLGTTASFAAVNNNAGTIIGGSSGATAFTGLLTQNGGNLTSGSGGLNLQNGLTNTSGNITVAAGRSMTIAGAVSYTAGTLSFASTSSVTYNALATTVLDADYGILALNSDAKSWALGASRTVNGTLTLGAGAATSVTGSNDLNVSGNVSLAANLTKAANAVVLGSGSAVSGANEIIGAVNRNHSFTATTPYTFNRAEVTLAVTTTGAQNVTIKNNPGTSPTAGTGLGTKYVNRQYTIAGANFATNAATLKLYYIDANLAGSPNENRLVFKSYSAGTWTTLAAGSYTKNVSSTPDDITLAGITSNFTSETELAMVMAGYVTIANGSWNVGTTWDAGDIPTSTDDADVKHTVAMNGANRQIANLTITGGTLNVDDANFTATSIDNAGTINVSNTRTLLVSGGNLTNSGAISNSGTITVQ
jgi:hypothetical protein